MSVFAPTAESTQPGLSARFVANKLFGLFRGLLVMVYLARQVHWRFKEADKPAALILCMRFLELPCWYIFLFFEIPQVVSTKPSKIVSLVHAIRTIIVSKV